MRHVKDAWYLQVESSSGNSECLMLLRSDQGDGGWSLHPRTDADAEPDAMEVLVSGTANWDDDRDEWDRPNEADIRTALDALKRLGRR